MHICMYMYIICIYINYIWICITYGCIPGNTYLQPYSILYMYIYI